MKKFVSIMLIIAMLAVAAAALSSCKDKAEVKVIEIKLTEEEYAFAVAKDNDALLGQINSILSEIQSDGTMDAIMAKYFGEDESKIVGIPSAVKDGNRDQLVVATNAEFAPFEYKIGDKFAGIDMEVAKVIAAELGKELVIEHMEFASVVTAVNSGYCDIGMAALTVNEERKQSVNFTNKYYEASQMIIVKADDTTFDECTTPEQAEAVLAALANKKVGVQTGTTGQYYAEGNEDWGFNGFSNLTVVGFSNGGLAVQDMINGNLDLVIIDEMPAKVLAKSFNK